MSANDQGDLAAQRASHTQIVDLATAITNPLARRVSQVALLGSGTHLIMFYSGQVHFYKVGSVPLISYVSSITMTDDPDGATSYAVCWESASMGKTFVYSCNDVIRIWTLDSITSRAEHVQDIVCMEGALEAVVTDAGDVETRTLSTIMVTPRFVVGNATENKTIRVYDRQSKRLLHVLCDANDIEPYRGGDEGDEDDDDEDPTLFVETIGDLLITSATLCIWHMRTGASLRQYNDAFMQNISSPCPGGMQVTSMIYLPDWGCPAFTTMDGKINLFAFPECAGSKKRLDCIERRETFVKNYTREGFGSDIEGDEGDY